MKIAILTTETSHHAYFVKALQAFYGDVTVIYETQPRHNYPFDTHHSAEVDRDNYEWQRWFQGHKTTLSTLVPTQAFPSLNTADAIAAIQQLNADVAIVFGTGILKDAVIQASPKNLFNLHGGDPERYRGLDTHLWAIYHQEFNGLITTLHRLDTGIDTGDIVSQSAIPLTEDMPLYTLRAANTEICVKLATTVIDMLARHGEVTSRHQYHKGRYYSAMPTALKAVCQKNFDAYIRTLNHA